MAAALDRVNDERQGWGDFLAALEGGTREERGAHLITFSHFLPRWGQTPQRTAQCGWT